MFTLLLFCAIAFAATAQQDTTATANQKKYTYCEIVSSPALAGAKITVEIDYGQKTKVFQDTRLKGKDGKPIKFNSTIDALNYMGSDGWELVQVYTTTYSADTFRYHYLLKKEAKQ